MDENDVAAKVAVEILERSVTSFGKSLDAARRKVSVKFRQGFDQYKQSSRERYGYLRTLLHRDKPIPLVDLYVKTHFRHDGDRFDDEKLVSLATHNCRLLVQGTAGGGKSVFMRFLNLVVSQSDSGILPVFYELRNLNANSEQTLLDAIAESVERFLPSLNGNEFKGLLRAGQVILILDGFDEINFDHRNKYAKEISELCDLYAKSSIIVSSRPDDLISSIKSFLTYSVIPFDKDQAIELLAKLPYDPLVKFKFINAVENELYEKHKEFLSNPLLITMMLMTYHQFAEIPSKIHIFYQQAFETLFSWHDSSKDVFKRKNYANLPIDEFQRAFSYFCANSYMNEVFEFSEFEIRSGLKDALAAEQISADSENFLLDLRESTCLMQKDGVNFTFAHRSFQEYFTALFISKMDSKSAKSILDSILGRVSSDLVLTMAHQINPPLIERAWILPVARSVRKKFQTVNSGDAIEYFSLFISIMAWSEQGGLSMYYEQGSVWGLRVLALAKLFPLILGSLSSEEIVEGFRAWRGAIGKDDVLREMFRVAFDGPNFEDALNRPKPNVMFRMRQVPTEIKQFINIDKWMAEHQNWLERMWSDLEKRVANRSTAIAGLLGGGGFDLSPAFYRRPFRNRSCFSARA